MQALAQRSFGPVWQQFGCAASSTTTQHKSSEAILLGALPVFHDLASRGAWEAFPAS